MKKIFLLFVGVILFFSGSLHAVTVTGTAPTTGNPTIDAALADAFELARQDAEDELNKYGSQSELAKGFANANAFSAQAATMQGYQDYKIFAVSTGVMIGAQLPSSDKSYYDDMDSKIKDDGDIYAGAGVGVSLVNVGINAGFLLPSLYLNAKFGYLSLNESDLGIDGLSTKTTLLGIGANYTWMQSRSLLLGAVKWRGVSFGTGFLYNMNNTEYKIELDKIEGDVDESTLGGTGITDATVYLDPSIKLGIKTQTYTFPFDVTTSVRLLWFLNINLGAGVDFTFGKSDITLKSDGDVTADLGVSGYTVNKGSFEVDGGTYGKSPSFVHARLTTGLGFNIWVFKIDIPVIYYPFEDAFAVGLTAGVVY